jgi:hypothetical protein
MASAEDTYSPAPNTPESQSQLRQDMDDIAIHEGESAPNSYDGELAQFTIHHHGKPLEISLPVDSTLSDLSAHVATHLFIPLANQKFMITPKLGLLKPPFNPDHSLSNLSSKKIVLMGSTVSEIETLSRTIASASAPRRAGPIKAAKPSRARDWKKNSEEIQYTFHSIRPLPYLPHPERSQRFLERLCDDPGIKASMLKHKFSVGLLTEMDPAMHTTHESRTLGLNRNRGEVIELRLRTDAYDGYRDYKTIRKTLCHELSHNVWGDHDRNFWNLTKEIEKEVERGDWTRGGRSVGEEEFYNPNDGGMPEGDVDHGGWTGGEFILGGGGTGGERGLSRREILAKAAEERMKRTGGEEGNERQEDGTGAA